MHSLASSRPCQPLISCWLEAIGSREQRWTLKQSARQPPGYSTDCRESGELVWREKLKLASTGGLNGRGVMGQEVPAREEKNLAIERIENVQTTEDLRFCFQKQSFNMKKDLENMDGRFVFKVQKRVTEPRGEASGNVLHSEAVQLAPRVADGSICTKFFPQPSSTSTPRNIPGLVARGAVMCGDSSHSPGHSDCSKYRHGTREATRILP